MKSNQDISINDYNQTSSTNPLQVYYSNDIQNQSIIVWFTIERSLNNMFDSFRFILRSIDSFSLSNIIIRTLTNFTKLVDFNNSLRIFNLETGQYEVCIEFQMDSTRFIYEPRDGCIPMRIGKSSFELLTPSPAPLLITLACSIVIFFILGLVVQWAKEKRRRKRQDSQSTRSRSSSFLSSISLKQQRDRLIKNLFHRHIEQPEVSDMRQWARDLTCRHRISEQEQNVKRRKPFLQWHKHFFPVKDYLLQEQPRTRTMLHDRNLSSEPILTRNSISTISEQVHYETPSRKISFDLSIPEEYEPNMKLIIDSNV
ncbi:unnamed protein product [Rotaria sp. Silwood1]|nr:unnamed protein product [Rotaria sp. Silwood1]CAF3434477.1 unnamed protein product [Rotaria sp. Silwood1]CAF4666644.1 unnamed protein product [Rotaria sp. Silwood1]